MMRYMQKRLLDALLGGVDRLAQAVHGSDATFVDGIRRSVQVDDYSCGAHATLSILRAFGRGRSLRATLDGLGTDEDGTAAGPIMKLLRRRGLSVRVLRRARMRDLDAAVEQGRPCIVSLSDGEHWGVVGGTSRSRVFVTDSSPWRWWSAVPRKRFRGEWDGWMMVVGPQRWHCR